MQNPKNSQRHYCLSVPHGAAAFATRRSTPQGFLAFPEPNKKSEPPSFDLSTIMKATSNTRSKTTPAGPIAKVRANEGDGQLFLGHKVLGELRILMRLASPTGNSQETSGNNGSHRSF